MVSLGVCKDYEKRKSTKTSKHALLKAIPTPQPRYDALWHPEIPAPHLDLNEKSCAGSPSPILSTNPRVWEMLSQDGDGELAMLTAIKACTYYTGRIGCLEFVYTDFMRNRSLGHKPGGCEKFSIEFKIDGPGGERIDSVHFSDGPVLSSMMVFAGLRSSCLTWLTYIDIDELGTIVHLSS